MTVYLLFVGDQYYPSEAGEDDFVEVFLDKDSAAQAGRARVVSEGWYRWARVMCLDGIHLNELRWKVVWRADAVRQDDDSWHVEEEEP